MKKVVSILLLLAIVAGGIYANGFSTLQLRSYNNLPMAVFVNGQLVSQNSQFVNIQQMPAGNNMIRINQFVGGIGFGQVATIQTIFNGNMVIPHNTLISAIVAPNQIYIESQQALFTPPQFGFPGGFPGQGYPNTGFPNVGFPNYPVQPAPPIWGGTPGGFVPPHFGYNAMAPDQFNRLKQSIINQSFSSGQRQVAEQAMRSNYFTAQQVYELVNLFTFNSDKLHISKRAYNSTLDKENYFIVYDALDYNSSVNELANYIASL
jgi:hypothetical protein